MSNNNWQEDHQFGTEEYKPLLDNCFYPYIAPHITKEEQIRRFSSKSYHDVVRQRKFKMDLEVELLPGVWFDIEEKVVRQPQDGKPPHTAFYYETESCSLPGLITPGWMNGSEAQCLLYAFEVSGCGLDIYLSKQFQEIKSRFWCELKKNPNCFPWHRNKGKNESQGRKVPIGFVTRNFPQTERYLLHLDGICERAEFSAIFLPYHQECAA